MINKKLNINSFLRHLGLVQFLYRSYVGGDQYTHPPYVFDPRDCDFTDSYLQRFTGEYNLNYNNNSTLDNILPDDETRINFERRKKFTIYMNYCNRIVNRYRMIFNDIYEKTVIINSPKIIFKDFNIKTIFEYVLVFGYLGVIYKNGLWELLDPRDTFILEYSEKDSTITYCDVISEGSEISQMIDFNEIKKKIHHESGFIFGFSESNDLIDSVIYNAAFKNNEVYNVTSWINDILSNVTFPQLCVKIKEDELMLRNQIQIGLNNVFMYFDTKPEYICPPSEPVNILMQRLDQLKKEIDYCSGLYSEADTLTEKHSGVSLSMLYEEKYSTLYGRVKIILECLENFLFINFRLQNLSATGFSFQIPNIAQELNFHVVSEPQNKEGETINE